MVANVSPWEYVPREFQVACPVEFDLSAALTSAPAIVTSILPEMWGRNTPTSKLVIKNVTLVYTEATNTTEANIIQIGSAATPGLYTTITTPTGKAIGDETSLDQADFTVEPRVLSDLPVWVTCVGTGGGTGMVRVFLTVTQNYSEWVGFDQDQASP